MLDDLEGLFQPKKPVTVADIYENMGLDDVDVYAAKRYEIAQKEAEMLQWPEAHGNRRLGTSTWMCAHAAVEVLKGKNVVMLDGFFSIAKEHAKLVAQMAQRYTKEPYLRQSHTHFQVGDAEIFWDDGKRQIARGRQFIEFDDALWKARLFRRLQGPYAMIREIREDDEGRFQGYAEDDEHVMEFTRKGAEDFLEKNPNVPLVRKGIALRGAFGSGVTKDKSWRELAKPMNFGRA